MATITIPNRDGAQLYRGEHADLRAAVVHCAASRVRLDAADLRGAVLDGADLSGLQAPNADLTGASLRGVIANRLVGGQPLDLSAALLQGCVITGNAITHANLACTAPTAMRASLGPDVNTKGVNWRRCADVLAFAISARGTQPFAIRNGTGWLFHTGDQRDGADTCLPEAQARVTHAARAEYADKLAWLESQEGVAAKATIDGRQVGEGEPLRPPRDAGQRGAGEPESGAELTQAGRSATLR